MDKAFSIHRFQICSDSSDSRCTGSHSFPPCASLCFVCCGSLLGKRWWEWVASRIERIELQKVHMNQLLLSDSCLIIHFLCFSLSWPVPLPIASAIVWLSGIERRIMSEGTQFFCGPLAWCFQTLELIALFPPHWPCLQWCFFSVHHFHKQSRVIIES